MNEVENVSRLIGDFYDASLDPKLWPTAFQKAAKYIGGSASYLFWQDILGGNSDGYFAAGHDPHFLELYHQKYFKLNPVFPTVVFHDVEQPLSIPDCLPQEDFCRSQFVREWVVPQGYVDVAFSNVEKSGSSCAVFTVMRHVADGFGDDEFRRRFALIVPHVRRALLIGKVINLHKVEAAALADSLDALVSAMFIVDGTGRIIHANSSGYAMIADTAVLRAPNGRLAAIDPVADQALLDVFTSAQGGDASLGKKGIALPLSARNEDRYVAHVLPLMSGARRQAGVSYGAVAAVFVRKATLDFPSPPIAIAHQFKLTKAELRVLFSVMEFSSVAEVAEVLGISEATAKTHLHHIFEKTGTGRQADLVKLIGGYCLTP